MRRKIPTLTPKKLIRALERGGFTLYRVKGSHHHFIHPDNPELLVVVPYHAKDMRRPLMKAIIKQADLTKEEFLDLLHS